MNGEATGVGKGLFGFARHRIPLSIGGLSAALLGVLILSTIVMAFEFTANQRRIEEATERFHRLQVADAAQRDFGTMRYWLTELASSLLTLSERQAVAARDRLAEDLDQLTVFAPDAANQIETAADAYWDSGLAAVDAYTDGNRVVGNSLMAQARQQSDAVTAILTSLSTQLSEEADAANARAAEESAAARIRALIVCAVIVFAGVLGTLLVLRSILSPLRRIDRAMSDIQEGREPADLPPEGPDELGRMSATVGALHEAQKARAALEAAAAEQRRTVLTAIETIPDGFALFDADDRMTLRNEQFLNMFPFARNLPEEATYEQFVDARIATGEPEAAGQDPERWKADCMARHQASAGSREEMPFGGGWLLVSQRRTPDGGTVAVFSDITELRQRQAELEDARHEAEGANAAKSRFLASMSHELRTPLNAIIGYSEMLIDDANDAGDTGPIPDLERIMSAGRHLLALINDILDLSKIEAGKMEVHLERVDLPELIEDVRLTVAPLVSKNDNTLVVSVDKGLGSFRTDRTKLRQNLFNLLSNAAKFTKNGEIGLAVAMDGEMVRFEVRDSGVGMTDEQVSRLFQPFVQAESSTASTYGGTGLGLSIVKQFCEMLGGSVTVTSEAGKGSVFTILLPADARTRDAATGQPTILIIDDDPSALASLGALVREDGYHVLTAGDAAEGIELARTHMPDAVLLDIVMPRRDGWSVLRELKEDVSLCEIPVILVSVVSDREMGLAVGAIDYLVKPVDAGRLHDALARLSGDRKREVLIVDDDSGTRALFRRLLAREGWMVREASDGERALALIAEHQPGLVILDLMMPNLDGFETLRRLRAEQATSDLPVIVATSKDLSRSEFEWLGEHARDVVRKGGDGRADLLAAIARHVSDQRAGGETGAASGDRRTEDEEAAE